MITNIEDYDFAVRWLFDYIYSTPAVPYEKLTDGQLEMIKMFQPKLPADEFPENFPEEDGYEGDYFELYRGMFFLNQQEYDSFMKEIVAGKMLTSSITSWSVSPETAERFAHGAGYFSYNQNSYEKGYKGVVLKISKVYLKSVLFSSYEAEGAFEDDFQEEISEKDADKIHHLSEEEMVLIPGSYEIDVVQVYEMK